MIGLSFRRGGSYCFVSSQLHRRCSFAPSGRLPPPPFRGQHSDSNDRESTLLDIPVVTNEQEFEKAVLPPLSDDKSTTQRDNVPEPVIWRGRMCEAMTLWAQPDYLATTLATQDTVCEVEWGPSYNHPSSQRLSLPSYQDYHMYLQQAIHDFGHLDTKQLLYMAQNQLPPVLYNDLGTLPLFLGSLATEPHESASAQPCQEEDIVKRRSKDRLYNINWWVGPAGCRSPLHHDPLDNVLFQITGEKKVWLISPTCHHSENGSNTSVVDVEGKDVPDYSQFVSVPIQTATLCPGDVLFIPSKWWHATRMASAAPWGASVNIWWR